MEDRNGFDPENISRESMNKLADNIEEYISLLKDVMVIPEELMEKNGKKIKDGIKMSEKLIKKLRKGDKSVFKDPEDWNLI